MHQVYSETPAVRRPADRRRIGPARRGRSDLSWFLAIGSLVFAAVLALGLSMLGRRGGGESAKPLTLFCAAGIRQPVEQIVAAFDEECGAHVQVQYGGSNTLLAQIEAGGMGDLLLVAEEMYADLAQKKGLIRERIPVVVQHAAIAVRKGNPRNIHGLDDLTRPDVRIALANPGQAAIGRLLEDILGRIGRWENLKRAVTQHGVFKPTVTDLANDLKLGTVDAAIVWDAMIRLDPEMEMVECPELKTGTARAVICVLSSARDPAAALRFARYVTAQDRGLKVFATMGYETPEGDLWTASPQLTFFIGLVARPAVEKTIHEFEQREGVVVNTVYNGCGILTAEMLASRDRKQGGFPDLYLAGDRCYLENVNELFQEPVELSETEITMLVEKGNPKGIHSLKDLTRNGVRVVVGHPQQCTVGFLSRQMLEREGLYAEVMKNVVSQMPTAAMMVPAMTTGSCDVALGWNTHALVESARLDTVPIDSKYTHGIQPLAIARSSDHKELARRLVQAIATSRERFESAGFRWRLPSPDAAAAPVSKDKAPSSVPSQPGRGGEIRLP